jgi:hypothetical protein
MAMLGMAPDTASHACAVANYVAASFEGDAPRFSLPFQLKDIQTHEVIEIVRNAKMGDKTLWFSERLSPRQGREHRLQPVINGLDDYEIKAVYGYNTEIGNVCYAIYDFTIKRESWVLEIRQDPPYSYEYQKTTSDGAKEGWTSANLREVNWRRVPLKTKESLKVKIFDGPWYLFTIPESITAYKPKYRYDYTPTLLAEAVLKARLPYSGTLIELQGNSPFKEDDPYMAIIKKKLGKKQNENSLIAAGKQIEVRLSVGLNALTLSDTTGAN